MTGLDMRKAIRIRMALDLADELHTKAEWWRGLARRYPKTSALRWEIISRLEARASKLRAFAGEARTK